MQLNQPKLTYTTHTDPTPPSHPHLHAQTDPEKRYLVFTCVLRCHYFPLHPANPEPPRHEDSVCSLQALPRVLVLRFGFFAGIRRGFEQVFGFYPEDVEVEIGGDCRVEEGFNYGLVRVGKT